MRTSKTAESALLHCSIGGSVSVRSRALPVTATTSPAGLQRRPQSTKATEPQVALKVAASRLARDFAGTFGEETIERFLHSSYDQFAGNAKVANLLPLLAERFARQRLQALAPVEGLYVDGKPVVLFLCVHNAARSQMALGFFEHQAKDNAIACSGGSEPGTEINPTAVAAMAERSIDISGEYRNRGPMKPSALPMSSSP
jgi:arsenate reductase (thioredoxin)